MKKNVICLVLTGAFIITGIFVPQTEILAKTKKVKLSAKKITMEVGNKKTLKIKNVKKKDKKKIKWSLNTKKYITLKKSGKYAVKLTAKKAGKTKVTVKVAKKKYTCTVTVKNVRPWPPCGTSDIIRPPLDEELYQEAVRDAMIAEEKEIHPLVTITKDSNMVTWNETGDKVLMLSWHKEPDLYPEKEDVVLSDKPVWTFTDREIVSKCKGWNVYGNSSYLNRRLRQVTGSKPDADYSHVTAFWVSKEDLIRPAYETDITKQMKISFSEEDKAGELYTSWYKTWFDQNIVASYFEDFRPWTRLGYTYDWAYNDTEYGLSEFLIVPGSNVQVEFTKTTDEFIQWMEQQSA